MEYEGALQGNQVQPIEDMQKTNEVANATEANEGCVSWRKSRCQNVSAKEGGFKKRMLSAKKEKSKDDMHTEMKSKR